MLAAGLDGLERELDCPPPVNDLNIYEMSAEELTEKGISQLPGSLAEALNELEGDEAIRKALGEVAYEAFTRAKWAEWNEYCTRVMDWEIEYYLETA
jgi:glutamine synthetase